MPANTDVLWPVQVAIRARLTGDATLAGKVTGVYDLRAPEGTGWPYITIGSLTSTPQGAHDRFGARTTVTLHVWSTYGGNLETTDIGSDLMRLLDHQPITIVGHDTVSMRWQQSVTVPDPDPDIRHLAIRFAVETEHVAA